MVPYHLMHYFPHNKMMKFKTFFISCDRLSNFQYFLTTDWQILQSFSVIYQWIFRFFFFNIADRRMSWFFFYYDRLMYFANFFLRLFDVFCNVSLSQKNQPVHGDICKRLKNICDACPTSCIFCYWVWVNWIQWTDMLNIQYISRKH